MNDEERVADWRRRIDVLDRRILDLLNERTRCALAIGAVKRRLGRTIYDPVREAAIVRQALEANRGPLQDDAIQRLFERILDESRRLERIEHDSGPRAAEGGKD